MILLAPMLSLALITDVVVSAVLRAVCALYRVLVLVVLIPFTDEDARQELLEWAIPRLRAERIADEELRLIDSGFYDEILEVAQRHGVVGDKEV
jgi:hypothetical protein